MRITFAGAAGGVTGSCTLVEAGKAKISVDCGSFQGDRKAAALNTKRFPFKPSRLDAVLLTHAHIDHCGRLPQLVAAGYRGPVVCTPATADLLAIMLEDAARIQEREAEDENRWRRRAGRPPVTPLFTVEDAARAVELVRRVEYDQEFDVAGNGLRAAWRDAGHILGSASIALTVPEGKESSRTVVFSGDIGPRGQPIVRDPEPAPECDLLIVESTYGDRDHPPQEETETILERVLMRARADGGALLIPAFAVGRTQKILYALKTLSDRKQLVFPTVYLDTPLGIKATEITRSHQGVFDEEARARVDAGRGLVWMPELKVITDRAQSIALNDDPAPKIVVAASGMCTAGPILHHLKHHLWRPETDVLIAGYQARGTLGRKLLDGARTVRIHDRPIAVRASIHEVSGMSAHADRSGLLGWARSAGHPRVLVNHGEPEAAEAFAGLIAERMGVASSIPQLNETIEL